MNKPFLFFIAMFISLFTLSGCTNKMDNVNDTVKALYDSYQDIELSTSEVEQLPYPSAYVRLNDGQQIYMVLAFADINPETQVPRLSWISSDRALIITEQGRIIKTVSLENSNLNNITAKTPLLPVNNLKTWQAQYHWMPDYRFNFEASMVPSYIGEARISSSQWQLDTKYYQERIHFPGLEQSFVNHYWMTSDKKVVKTIQYIGPNLTKIEMTFLKTYAVN
ncbi:YjbF family lipoprotein [Vibrio tapetis]|uniref:YjbF family lipoprotein n=1 Tax=Vibrio tapetis subsp. tapetis TaxID=1671868 RepID=A0A2N8ZGI6_9VIBR|nr:YjbF family lipoprotein [Vibrio tapetis]SON51022.1 conserved exported protein of unknown function [Vibrio tapetis subsp. tapetis]